MNETDLELLKRYCRDRSEEAFAEIVGRHLDLVHSAALRQVRSPQLAEEVAQSVFTDLARNAHRLAPDTILTAWLYQVTHRTAIDVVRRETRRQLREQTAQEMNALNTGPADWTRIEPLLDEAMHALEDVDRAAILLRYFDNKSLREVGQNLGTSEDAAQKRVSRAVDRLRDFLAKRGIAVGAGGLAAILSANAVHAAPLGLAVSISTAAALAGTTLPASTALAATQAVAMTTLQKTILAATLAAALGTAVFEARQTSRLRDDLQTLQQQQAATTGQIDQLTRERDDAIARRTALQQENDQLRQATAEIPKLRGEVAGLRTDAQELARLKSAAASPATDPVESAAKSWLARVNLLRDRVEQRPEARIPEFQFLTEEDWLNCARKMSDSDSDDRKVLSELRHAAEKKFVSRLQPALRKFMQTNNSQFPTELTQLQPYFEAPLDQLVLQRWKVAPADEVPNVRVGTDWIVTQKAPVDPEKDLRLVVGPDGSGGTNFK